jgi:hypothetical protein
MMNKWLLAVRRTVELQAGRFIAGTGYFRCVHLTGCCEVYWVPFRYVHLAECSEVHWVPVREKSEVRRLRKVQWLT